MKDSIYHKRRVEFSTHLKNNSVALLHSNEFLTRSNDTEFPYRQNSNFYYLSGIIEDESVIVFKKSKNRVKTYLFVKEVTKEESLWVGKRMGVRGAYKKYTFDKIYNIDSFEKKIEKILKNSTHLYYDLFLESKINTNLKLTCKSLLSKRALFKSPTNFSDINQIIHKMRLIKDKEEISLIKKAISITKEAHHRAMLTCKPEKYEYEIAAEMEYVFAKHGASHNAYESIVAGANRANTLHYIDNNKLLKDNTLVLIDAGCEYKMYASDITRTFPVNGRFTQPQKELYEMVLDVQEKIIKMVRAGITKNRLQKASEKLLTKGMIDLGILKGSVKKLIKEKKHKRYYPHGIGHWMGIDVHDPLPYVDEELKPLTFKEGMILTIEPGIYIDKNDKSVPKRYRGIAIRIEDDILVKKDGYENLSKDIIKSVDEIEKLMQCI
jgi:Xaa-Pro aminopeptidase